ncbi:MAG: transposase [Verrucomicrobia bacterium]|nr:transposase [Verrucomicrobiota bacterium]
MVRQLIKERPKAAGRQLRLFQDDTFYNKYRYSCFVTNLTLPARSVYDLYRGRADAENRIKELKYDFGMDKFNNKDFWSTEAMLNFVVLAYNLMSLFRQNILRTKRMPFLRTIHYQVFDIAGYMIKQGNQRVLKLAIDMKRRRWFKGLWSQCQDSLWPFVPPPLHDP